MNNSGENNVFEFAFSFKAKEVKFNCKGKANVSVNSNQKLDTIQENQSKNLLEKFEENKIYYRVEKKSVLCLRIYS